MSDKHDPEVQKAVRISHAIECASIVLTAGLIAIAAAVAEGWAQLVLFVLLVLFLCILGNLKHKELQYYGLWTPETDEKEKTEPDEKPLDSPQSES